VTRKPLSVMQGGALDLCLPGYVVRPATAQDADACNALCHRVHGFERSSEVADTIARGSALVTSTSGGSAAMPPKSAS